MKRLSLILAIVSAFALGAPAGVSNAGCTPDPALDIFCNYLAIPQSTCRGIIANPNVPQDVRELNNTVRTCEKIPNGVYSSGQDANVFILAQSIVEPREDAKVGVGKNLYVHNTDSIVHTFTDLQCLDANSGTPCRFNRTLQVGEWGLFAQTITMHSSLYPTPPALPRKVSFKCRLHAGYEGSFDVTT